MKGKRYKYHEIIGLFMTGHILLNPKSREFIKMKSRDFTLWFLSESDGYKKWRKLTVFCPCRMVLNVYAAITGVEFPDVVNDFKAKWRFINER
jgi:hypothetical protein